MTNVITELHSPRKPLTGKQIENTYRYVTQILNNLTDKALQELIDGYGGDLDKLLNEILVQTSNIINFNSQSLESEKLDYLEYLEISMDEQFKVLSYNYFKSTCLTNFTQNWRNLEWGNMVQLYPWSAYLCQRGAGKCLAPGTQVVMYDGTLKTIENIAIGDLVMGIDGTSRTVLCLHSGIDNMYKVKQKYSLDYEVNSQHIMHFEYQPIKSVNGVRRVDWNRSCAQIVEMPAEDLANKTDSYIERCFGRKVEGWDLLPQQLLIEPRWLGLWLGDGTGCRTDIASIDTEIVNYIEEYAARLGLRCTHSVWRNDRYVVHKIAAANGGSKDKMSNKLIDYLREYNLLNNKHIPDVYLRSSRQQRLELLAGLIDSDGHITKRRHTYVFSQKSREFMEQVQCLCWSLGFRANITEHTYNTNRTKSGQATTCQLHISGKIWLIPCLIPRKQTSEFIVSKPTVRCGLSIQLGQQGQYYGFTLDGDHLFLLKDGTVVKNSFEFCYAFPLWRLFSYKRPHPLIQDTADNRLRKETCLITNESRLGNLHIAKIVEEIKLNDILSQKMNPTGKANLGKEAITTESGAILHKRSYGSFIRGLHVGAVMTDDFLDKSCLYSKDQRDKFHETFYAEIKSIVEQGGYNLVSGTPFHQQDLYGDLAKDNMFRVFTYPGILPNKELLAPDRFTFEYLMELKRSLGSIVFAREILVSPISDQSSLFPWEYLRTSFIGMEGIRYVDNIDSFPIKMERITVGCDFAISGKIGADYTDYRVWGRGKDKKYYLLHFWRKRGASHNEQINQIISIDNRFKPNKIRCEANGFQGILSDMAKGRGLKNIEEFTTTSGNKKDLYQGLPSLSAMFERGDIKLPYHDDEETRNATNHLCGEFHSITFNEDSGKLESSDQHDDAVMSSFMAINDLRENDKMLEMFLI